MPKNTTKTLPKSVVNKTRRFTKKTTSLNMSPKKSGAIFATSTTSEDEKLDKVLKNSNHHESNSTPKKCKSVAKRKKTSPSKDWI
jgi:hypothetical protein